MFLTLYKWLNPNKAVVVFDKNHLPEVGDTITVNGMTATFGQEPAVYITDDVNINFEIFEEHYRKKFGHEAMLVTVGQGHNITRVY